MLIDEPGPARDALAAAIATLPESELVLDRPELVVVDDRLFNRAVPLMRAGIPTVVVGVQDDPAFAARARREGAVEWIPKESFDSAVQGLLATVRH